MTRYRLIAVLFVMGCGAPAGGGGSGQGGDADSAATDSDGFNVEDSPSPDLDVPRVVDPGTPLPDVPLPPKDEGPWVPDDGPAPPDPGPPPPDGGPPPPDDGNPPPPGKVYGGVLVAQIETSDIKLGSVSGGFGSSPTVDPTPVAETGPCKVVYSTGQDPPPVPGLDAGPIVLTGLNQPVTLTPVAQAGGVIYQSGLSSQNPSIFGAEPNIGVSAAGGPTVPAWNAVIPVPVPVQIAAPAGDSVKKNQPLIFQWNAVAGMQVRIDIFVYDGMAQKTLKGNTVVCTFADDVTSWAVPKELMSLLPGGGEDSFPDFNFDYAVWLVTRVSLVETTLPDGLGTITAAASRSGGGAAKLKKK